MIFSNGPSNIIDEPIQNVYQCMTDDFTKKTLKAVLNFCGMAKHQDLRT